MVSVLEAKLRRLPAPSGFPRLEVRRWRSAGRDRVGDPFWGRDRIEDFEAALGDEGPLRGATAAEVRT
jgi:hypothetical protein